MIKTLRKNKKLTVKWDTKTETGWIVCMGVVSREMNKRHLEFWYNADMGTNNDREFERLF